MNFQDYSKENEGYQKRLDQVYGAGIVKPLERVINNHSSILFYCDKCGAEFYNTAGYMVGKDGQKHLCTLPYADIDGIRLSRANYDKRKSKKGKQTDILKEIDGMLDQGLNIRAIAAKTQLNKHVIQFYIDYKEQQRLKEIQKELGLG